MTDRPAGHQQPQRSDEVVKDACCLLNLAATGRLPEILSGLPYLFVVGPRARGEALYLRSESSEAREPVDLTPWLADGLLREHPLHTAEEQAIFVALAALVGDGEAEAAAIAVARAGALATDDRKVRRVVAERHPEIRLMSTLELLQEWQALCGVADVEVAMLLRRIAVRATYRPRRTDPLIEWWRRLVPDL